MPFQHPEGSFSGGHSHSSLEAGPIPDWSGPKGLQTLEELWLNGNNLNGSFPAGFGRGCAADGVPGRLAAVS